VRKRKTVIKRRRPASARVATKSKNPAWALDIFGIALILCCPVLLVALAVPARSGTLGFGLSAALKVAFGIGAYIIPFLLALLGVVFIMGPLETLSRHLAVGSAVVFLAIEGLASSVVGVNSASPADGGGYLGFAFAYSLHWATGNVIPYILLTGVAVVGIVHMVNEPLAHLITRLIPPRDNTKAPAAQRETARVPVKVKERPEPKPERAEKTGKGILERLLHREESNPETAIVPVEESSQKRIPVKINGVHSARPSRVRVDDSKEQAVASAEPVEEGEYQLPPSSLLNPAPPPPVRVEAELRLNIETIERTLNEFKVPATVVEIAVGPTVARYEIQLAPGIKVSKITQLADNLAMQLEANSVRVEAPIPGKAAIGVEVPNQTRGLVCLRELVESQPFQEGKSKLTFALGKDVAGNAFVANLERMPHMLIGGATNAGKSVCLNTLIASLLFRATPDELKFVMIDPKRVELTLFDGIPHLACPVVKDVKVAAGILRSVVQEMERRYQVFERVAVRNLAGYNEKVPKEERLPFMVVVVDELCDLMMQCAAEVEGTITRLAQLARATGIHLVIATQRPSVDVITGVIKANISSRIAFAVSSHHDSRTILDSKGAERLLGSGDMLFLPIDASKPARIQGCYVSEKEIEALVDFIKNQRKPVYTLTPSSVGGDGGMNGEDDQTFADEYYEPSVRFVVNTGYCSTSMLQRKFKIGYTRAARIVDAMEMQGIVGALDGAKPRQVLISKHEVEAILSGQQGIQYGPGGDDEDEDDYVPPPIEDEEEQEE